MLFSKYSKLFTNKQIKKLSKGETEMKRKMKMTETALAVGMILVLSGCGAASSGKAEPDKNGNYLINGSFEEVDFTGWTVTNIDNVTEELDVYTRETDCFEGAQSMHFYSGSNNVDFMAEQTVSGLEDGTYKLTAHIQGEAAGDENAEVYFYAVVGGEQMKADGELNGYVNWYTVELTGITPTDGEITVGVRVSTAPGGWGTIDDISLVKE